jgi:hypothetical protein
MTHWEGVMDGWQGMGCCWRRSERLSVWVCDCGIEEEGLDVHTHRWVRAERAGRWTSRAH